MGTSLRRLLPLLGVALFAVALLVLRRELAQHPYDDVLRHVREVPGKRIAVAALLTLASYLTMTVYDVLGLRYAGKPLPLLRIAPIAFVASAFSQNVGFSVLSGGTVRFRMYSAAGLSGEEIARVIGFASATFWLGFAFAGGALFLVEPIHLPLALHLRVHALQPIGALLLAVWAAYVAAALVRKTPWKVRGVEVALPRPSIVGPQLLVAALDWTLAAAVLYVVMPRMALPFPAFMAMYLLAQIAGVLSQVPGGLGVFESVLVALVSPYVPGLHIFGALVVYRAVYYLVPLAAAALVLAGLEIAQRRGRLAQAGALVSRWFPLLAPNAFAGATFVAGAVLLFSGALPGVKTRLGVVERWLHLSIIEASHFLASFIGASLVLLARGLQRRLDGAWALTSILLGAGVVLSLTKGGDYEEATILAVVLIALVASREQFYRKASLLNEPFTAGWIAAIAMVLIASIWLGAFAFQHIGYSHELWWQFELEADAPRFLRGSVAAVGAVALFGVTRLIRPHRPAQPLPTERELGDAMRIALASAKSNAHLAVIGDKSLLFDEKRTGFIMYGVEGKTFVSMGDPVGPPQTQVELAWRFRELCDEHAAWPAFYQVDRDNLALYIELGLSLFKFGEEARVPLASFSLEGSARKSLRQNVQRTERDGHRFSILDVEQVRAQLPALKAVSDAWLEDKHVSEKGFSLGYWDEAYLTRYPVAVVHRDEQLVAFANVWPSETKEELSVDLMRFMPGARVMDYLFTKLMLWGKDEGYRWFNLGMAPLSGLENRALAPLWSRLGALVFRCGEDFYNFQGLRQYKEKFGPEWQPKFLACPGGLVLPQVLASISSLVSRGIKGAVGK